MTVQWGAEGFWNILQLLLVLLLISNMVGVVGGEADCSTSLGCYLVGSGFGTGSGWSGWVGSGSGSGFGSTGSG